MHKSAMRFFFLMLFGVLFSSCSYTGKKQVSTADGWKLTFGDDQSYASPTFDDSAWQPYELHKSIEMPNGTHYFWMRKTVVIPQELSDGEVYLGFDKISAAFEVYADGVFIGERGSFPPNENVRTENSSMILIPSSLIHNGAVSVAIRVYGPQTAVTYIDLTLGNKAMSEFTNVFRAIFNQHIFLIMSMLCLFLCFYSLSEFVSDKKDSSFIYYACSLFFIALYFYDLGSITLVFPYNLQRALARPCLPVSMNFMLLFLMKFMDKKYFKLFKKIILIVNPFVFLSFFLVYGKGTGTDTLFMIYLLPIFSVIVYGIAVTSKALKYNKEDMVPLFTGFIIGSALGVHDIICIILKYNPFMWLQGISFFCLNIAVFITVASHSSRMKRQYENLAQVTASQRDKLTALIENTKKLSEETSQIVSSLNTTVDTVVQASSHSAKQVQVINSALSKEKGIREETSTAVNGFAEMLSAMSKELEQEADTIKKSAQDTAEVIKGIDTVGNGISTAAQFATTLTSLTRTGSSDMRTLTEAMDKVQSSSKEILSVAGALDDFAQQTDLLAMNASIEAAHAGEFGKGFAVIAHEIKSLASASSQRSAKIGEIVQSIAASVDQSVALSAKVNETLGKIQTGALQSAEKVGAASEGMKAQQIAGAKIASESSAMAKSAVHMKDEASTQHTFSVKVLQNMEALSSASGEVDKASADISSGSKLLEEQAQILTQLSERTKHASEELTKLMNS
jgi:methyl-accepting chemotaxis protein